MSELRVTRKRHYSAHNDLLRIGSNFLFACEQEERWCGEGHFVSLVMCALAVESICNTAGELVYPDWKSEFEPCSPKAKIRILCEKLSIKYDRGEEPFQTLHWLVGFRNRIAHAKPEPIEVEEHLSFQQFLDLQSSCGPQSKIEKEITIESARKALANVENFKQLLAANLPEEKAWVIEGDSWEMHGTPSVR